MKKIISILISCVFVFSCIQFSVYAEENNENECQHIVTCTDMTTCIECGKTNLSEEEIDMFIHGNELLKNDQTCHWRECAECGEETMPQIVHYTSCVDPDGPCDFCGMPAEEMILQEDMYGFHTNVLDELVKGEDGKYAHISHCSTCGKDNVCHKALVYIDFGSDQDHIVKCSCGVSFGDMAHSDAVLTGETEASCESVGYTGDKICEDCGHVFEKGSEIKALGHEFKDGICIRCGKAEAEVECHHAVNCADPTTCIYCGKENLSKKEIELFVHANEVLKTDSKDHWRECTECGEVTMPHLAHYTSCLDPDGACDYCEMPAEEMILEDNNRGFHTNAYDEMVKDEDGVYAHQAHCNDCGKDLEYHKQIVFNDFGSDEYHGVKCSCGVTFSDMAHSDAALTGKTEASCEKEGYTGDKICKDCGHVFEKGSTIKALGHEYKDGKCIRCGAIKSDVPKTGDTNDLYLWIVLLVSAVVCATVAGKRLKNR